MTEDVIRQYINEELSKDGQLGPVRDEDPLLELQILDSLGLFQLVSYLEDEFDIDVQDEELVPANFGSVRDIARFVREKGS
jgi:acyl carrier protein